MTTEYIVTLEQTMLLEGKLFDYRVCIVTLEQTMLLEGTLFDYRVHCYVRTNDVTRGDIV